jgi:ADP-heptose:LPS heptosyltransferase
MNLLESVERVFRRGVVYPVLRLLFRNPAIDSPIDITKVKRVLVFRYDRIGDMVVTLPVLRVLKQRSPTLRLAVLASRANAELLRDSHLVDDLYVLETGWRKFAAQVLELRRQRFDVVLNFIFNRTTTPAILANLISPHGVKIGQGPSQYSFYFNRILQLPRFERHMVEQLALFVSKAFGITIPEEELQPAIEIPPTERVYVDTWLRSNSLHRREGGGGGLLPYVVFNLSAGKPQRKISARQGAQLAACLSGHSEFRTVIFYAPDDSLMQAAVRDHSEFERCLVFRAEGTSPLLQLASLIGGAICVITPDTSIVHFASAMGTPLLGVFGDYQGAEWSPYRVFHHMIRSVHDAPASTIEPSILVKETDEFIATVVKGVRRSDNR